MNRIITLTTDFFTSDICAALLRNTYADVPVDEITALINNAELVEIAVNNASAEKSINITGDEVTVVRA